MRPDRLAALLAAAIVVALAPSPAPVGASLALGSVTAITSNPPVASAARGAAPPLLVWEVVSRRPHDPEAWTQGLELDEDGRLFESTGLDGRSTIREVDPVSGTVLRSVALPDDHFGEGITLAGGRLIGLTYQEGVATARDPETFEALERFAYEGEGWGLCFDGRRLVMSDGSDRLTVRDAATFEVVGEVAVTLAGEPLAQLNELECVDGDVWANVWLTDHIVRIDAASGEVTGVLDLAGLLVTEPMPGQPLPDILNGIAWDEAAGTFLVTGKLWPEVVEVRVRTS
jgi:glutaminyl-peptide cyclotransferase